MSTIAAPAPGVGGLLRDWRTRRRLSQLDLSLEAGVSSRHLSFVETGRSRPSRDLVLHLAEHLQVPLRERNALLLAAGFAPVHDETPLEDDAMAPVRAALEMLLKANEPFPALVVDRRWELVARNAPAGALLAEGVAEHLLAPPCNTLRVVLHPEGLAPRIANLAEYGTHLLTLVHRAAILTGDPQLEALHAELAGYSGVAPAAHPAEHQPRPFVPLRLRRVDGVELTLFSTISTFGTALDVTLAELMVESFFPADPQTAAALGATPYAAAGSAAASPTST